MYTESEVANAVKKIVDFDSVPSKYSESFCSKYYQSLHEKDFGYIENNWLLEDVNAIAAKNYDVVLELGCGNGRFAVEAAKYIDKIIAIDWASSPFLKDLPSNVEFIQSDITKIELPQANLTCSADFLEHLPPNVLIETIEKIIKTSPYGYHRIACYDDGHSHLSIMPAWKWLDIFKGFSSDYKLLDVEFRRGRLSEQVITVANWNI